jgi:hypothetical protein
MSTTKVTDAMRNVTAVDGTKISGTIPVGALGNAPATDLTPVHQGIATLGLHIGVADNKAAFNLPNAFIDTFEDDTGTTTRTDVSNADEYFASVSTGSQTLISGGTGTIIGSQTASGLWDGSNTTGQTSGAGANDWAGKDWGVGVTKTINGYGAWNNENTWGFNVGGSHIEVKLQGSTDNFSSSIVDLGTTGSVVDGAGLSYPYHIEKLTGITTTTAYRYHRILFNNTTDIRWSELELYDNPIVVSATGTLISDTQTAPTATTEVSGVILYKDNGSSSTVLGTHLKIYFTADNGSNWTEASSYGTSQTFSGTTKQVKLGKTTVTSGTQVAMKAVWASQTSGGYETQLHGWAVNY